MSRLLLLITVAVLMMFGADAVRAQDSPAQVKDKKLKITKKSFPRTDGRCSSNGGLVKIKATFDNSGVVTVAEVVESSGCDYFDKQSLNSARKIKFEPQVTDGEPVTVIKVIQYSFSSY